MVLSFKKKIPTLLELCIQTAIDNVRYIGDVGETDIYLLKDILPHCTADQLMHIENSSEVSYKSLRYRFVVVVLLGFSFRP